MLKQINIDNIIDIEIVQSTFYEVFKQKDELIHTLRANPYVKLCTYSVDKKVVAFIQYQDIGDRFELDNIFVLDGYRNKGIASILMECMIKDAETKNVINITLEVREDNMKAINLYRRYGFVEKAIRKNYYKDCNAILMEKEMM